MSKKEIIEKNNAAFLPIKEDSKLMEKITADAGQNIDHVEAEDLAFPRIKILQATSKEIKKSHELYVEEAEEGDMLNTLTSKVIKGDEGFLFIPAKRTISYLEWSSDFQLIANYGDDPTVYNDCMINEKGEHIAENGNEVVKNYNVFGYLIDIENKNYEIAIIPMSKSKMRVMKKWNTLIMGLCDKKTSKQLPSYAGVYRIKTIPQTYKNNSWFNYDIKFMNYTLAISDIGEKIYNKCRELFESMTAGKIKPKVNYEKETNETEEGDKI